MTRNTIYSIKHVYRDIVFCLKCDLQCTFDTHHREESGATYRYYHCKGCDSRINEVGIDKEVSDYITLKLLEVKNKNASLSIKRKITEFRQQQIALEQLRTADVISVKTFRMEVKALVETKDKYLQRRSLEMNVQLNWSQTTMKKRSELVKKYITKIIVNLTVKTVLQIF